MMRIVHKGRTAAAVLLLGTSILWANSGKDWPQWRGKNVNSTVSATDVFKSRDAFGLSVGWKQPLGSGYSSVSILDKWAVTMFSDGTFDYVVALDADNGAEKWRFKIDSTYVGHDGSHDGPIATPLITESKVYVLGPKGHLLALDLQTGKEIWSKHLVDDLAAQVPFYGFATSPTRVGNNLILETGGSNSTISAFDKETGDLLWSAGADTVNYQSPGTLTINRQPQLLCIGDKYLYGIEPASGKMLWEYKHNGGGQSINPVVVDGNKVFLQYKWQESVLVEVTENQGRFVAEERWKNRSIRGTYNTPVYHDGYLYGYSSRFLTCVDAKTGKSVWKSRQPGDGFVILVDGHLVLVTKKGSLHIARATPEKYTEVASLNLFDGLSWTPASFANGRIYARSLSEVAAVDVVDTRAMAKTDDRPAAPNSRFAQFIRKVEASANKRTLLDEFMKKQLAFPIIEGENLVHFVYRGRAEDVAMQSDATGFRLDVPMTRVAGTDFFYHTLNLQPDARIDYRFIIDFDKTVADSMNTRFSPSFFGPTSWVAMPKWQEPNYLHEPAEDIRLGRMDSLKLQSKLMKGERKLDIYLPAGYDEGTQRYPVLYVHGGGLAQTWGKMKHALDNLTNKEIAPVIVVFIPQDQKLRGREYTGDLKDKYVQMIAEELIPLVDHTYRTVAGPGTRAAMGVGSAGFTVMYAAFKYPGVIGKIASQSALLLTAQEKELYPLVTSAKRQPAEIYLDWGTYDIFSPLEGWDIGAANAKLAQFLSTNNYSYAGGEFAQGYSWGSWRNRAGNILKTFFALK